MASMKGKIVKKTGYGKDTWQVARRKVVAFALLALAFMLAAASVARAEEVASPVPGYISIHDLALLEGAMTPEQARHADLCYSEPNASGYRVFCGHPNELRASSMLSQAFAQAFGSIGVATGSGLVAGKDLYQAGRSRRDLRTLGQVVIYACLAGIVLIPWGAHKK